MNIEREYIKELYGDIEKLEEEIQKLKETQNFEEQMETLKTERDMVYHQNKELSLQLETLKNFGKDNAEYVTSLEEENKELNQKSEDFEEATTILKQKINVLKDEKSKLEKDLKNVKENVRKPVTINNNSMEIFEELKKGNIITFLEPNFDKSYKSFTKNPFVFELDNKGAIYQGELIGMYERKNGCVRYFYENKAPKGVVLEIIYNIVGCIDSTFECKLRFYKTGRAKIVRNMTYQEILKTNPILNLKLHKFESYGNYKFIYEEQDGSKYIIKQGQKEYI